MVHIHLQLHFLCIHFESNPFHNSAFWYRNNHSHHPQSKVDMAHKYHLLLNRYNLHSRLNHYSRRASRYRLTHSSANRCDTLDTHYKWHQNHVQCIHLHSEYLHSVFVYRYKQLHHPNEMLDKEHNVHHLLIQYNFQNSSFHHSDRGYQCR